jgi:hypothetical protein
MLERRILVTRGGQPRMAPRPGFGYPHRGSTVDPPRTLRRGSVHRLHPSRPSPRSARAPSRASLPSWRCSRRIASLPRGACGRGRLQGFDLGASSFCRSGPRGGPARRCLLGLRPSRAFSPPVLIPALRFAGPPLARLGRDDVLIRLRHRVLRSERVGVVPLGTTGSPGLLSPCDRRGTTRAETEGGLMVSPHGSGTLQAARADPSPLVVRPDRDSRLGRRRRPSVNGRCTLPFVNTCISKNGKRQQTAIRPHSAPSRPPRRVR